MAPRDDDTNRLGFRDSRIDKVASWGLTSIAGVAFSIGAWTFNGLTSEVRGLREDLNKIATRLAVVESAELDKRLRDLEHRVDRLEARGEVRGEKK